MSQHPDPPHRRAGHQRPRPRRPARHRRGRRARRRGRHRRLGGQVGRRAPGRRGVRRRRACCAPRLRRQPQPPGLRRRPGGGVRGPDGRRALRRGRHPHHVAATREATDEQLTSHVARLVQEMRRQGTTTVEIKSGYGLTTRTRPAASRSPASSPTRPPSWRTRRPRRHRPGRLRRAGHRPDARGRPPAREVDRRVLRARGLRRRPGARRPRGGPGCRAPGAAACQPARARARRPAGRELGLLAVDHCTYLDDADVDALRDSGTIATLLPGVEFSTRQPYPDVRRLLDAGVRVALASDCNPGSCFTSSIPLCVALAVREMGMTPAEAVYAVTRARRGRARSRRRGCAGPRPPGRPGAARRSHPRAPRLPARRPARRRRLAVRPAGLSDASATRQQH